jgi:hypothetical protein
MNRHETDVLSMVFGVAFLAVAAVWVVAKVLDISWLSIGWLFAVAMVVIGLLGLLSVFRRPGHRRQTS